MAAQERAVGADVSNSLGSVVCRFTLVTSTIGVSPLTVIVSASEPTIMSVLMDAVNVPDSSIPSRLTVLKPVSVKVTA